MELSAYLEGHLAIFDAVSKSYLAILNLDYITFLAFEVVVQKKAWRNFRK